MLKIEDGLPCAQIPNMELIITGSARVGSDVSDSLGYAATPCHAAATTTAAPGHALRAGRLPRGTGELRAGCLPQPHRGAAQRHQYRPAAAGTGTVAAVPLAVRRGQPGTAVRSTDHASSR